MKGRTLLMAPVAAALLLSALASSNSALAASQETLGRTTFTCERSTATLQPPRAWPPSLELMGWEDRNHGPAPQPNPVAARELRPACQEGEVPVAAIHGTRHFPKGNPLLGPDTTHDPAHVLPGEFVERNVLLPFDQVYADAGSSPVQAAPRATGNASPSCYNYAPGYVACYYWASVAEQGVVDGAGMTLAIEAPAVDSGGATNGHSIGQIAVSGPGYSGVSLDDVEMGFSVSQGQWGNSNPHLFVYHFIGEEATCYDSCDWNQYSGTYYPGMDLSPLLGERVYIGWVHYQGAWWAWFNRQWMGYINDSAWANAFTQAVVVQWYGEVAEIGSDPPYTQMGNGQFAENTTSASMMTLCDVDIDVWVCGYGKLRTSTLSSHPEYYDILNTRIGGVRYGGPGASTP